MIMFWLVFITQIVVIEPKLDVWYFMLSTTLISVKLLMSFVFTCRSKPGYIESEIAVTDLLQKVPAQHICFDCSVIKEPGSHHCQACGKCVSKFEKHSVWLDTCIGR